MFILSRIIFLIIICFGISYSQVFFNADGKEIEKVAQRTRQPKMIMDTVKLTDGVGVLLLRENFTLGNHSVKATSGKHIIAIITQILYDTTGTVRYYGYFPTKNGDSLIIKSSNNADTSVVAVNVFVR